MALFEVTYYLYTISRFALFLLGDLLLLLLILIILWMNLNYENYGEGI